MGATIAIVVASGMLVYCNLIFSVPEIIRDHGHQHHGYHSVHPRLRKFQMKIPFQACHFLSLPAYFFNETL